MHRDLRVRGEQSPRDITCRALGAVTENAALLRTAALLRRSSDQLHRATGAATSARYCAAAPINFTALLAAYPRTMTCSAIGAETENTHCSAEPLLYGRHS